MRLSDLKPGQGGRIMRIGATGPLKRRLMDMGVVAGTEVRLQKIAPLGDPLEISLKGYRLSLRIREAETIEMEEIDQR